MKLRLPKNSRWEMRVLSLIVNLKDKPIFDESATTVRIEDEAAGEYVVVKQDSAELKFDVDEWGLIKEAVEYLLGECRIDLE